MELRGGLEGGDEPRQHVEGRRAQRTAHALPVEDQQVVQQHLIKVGIRRRLTVRLGARPGLGSVRLCGGTVASALVPESLHARGAAAESAAYSAARATTRGASTASRAASSCEARRNARSVTNASSSVASSVSAVRASARPCASTAGACSTTVGASTVSSLPAIVEGSHTAPSTSTRRSSWVLSGTAARLL